MKRRLLALLLFALPCPAQAVVESATQAIMADLSENEIRIDTRFTGADLVLFGNRNESGDVIVVIRGPKENFGVRKKERLGGIWMNRQHVKFKAVPQFHALASSKPLTEMDASLQAALGIRESSLLPQQVKDVPPALLKEMRDALLKRQERMGLFKEGGKVEFVEDSLFKTFIPFPDTIPRGRYLAEVYLINGTELQGFASIPIQVYKSGTEAFIYDLAHRHSFLYGAVAVLVALIAGAIASTVFEKFYV